MWREKESAKFHILIERRSKHNIVVDVTAAVAPATESKIFHSSVSVVL